jgi:hypothetical protein
MVRRCHYRDELFPKKRPSYSADITSHAIFLSRATSTLVSRAASRRQDSTYIHQHGCWKTEFMAFGYSRIEVYFGMLTPGLTNGATFNTTRFAASSSYGPSTLPLQKEYVFYIWSRHLVEECQQQRGRLDEIILFYDWWSVSNGGKKCHRGAAANFMKF